MPKLRIIPILGLKTDVSPDDISLFRYMEEGVAMTYDVGGINVDYSRKRNVATKAMGYSEWSNSTIATPARCLGLFELVHYGTDARNNINFENGEVFYYDGSKDPQQLNNAILDYDTLAGGSFANGDTITGGTSATTALVSTNAESGTTGTLYLHTITGGTGDFINTEVLSNGGGVTAAADGTISTTTFANTEGDIYDFIRFGQRMIFADRGEHTPYKWKNGDDRLTILITKQGATAHTFRFLAEWQRSIIGAYSNQTNGDIEIRWTDQLPDFTDLDFPATYQLYKPADDSITGISKMGANNLYLYGTDSICRFEYYNNISVPIGLFLAVDGQGCAGHSSIVNAMGANFFFNRNYGFVRYLGGNKIINQDIISKDIEDEIASIDSRYYDRIVGKHLPFRQQIAWAVPLSGATTPSHILYYDLTTGLWQKEDKAARYIDAWTRAAGEYPQLVFGNADGNIYQVTGETLPGASVIDGYRIEPIMDFGSNDKKLVKELWWGITDGGDYSLHLWHRGGNTIKEVTAASWVAVGTLNLNSPSEPVIYINQVGRYHQFKWGTDTDSEKFGINWIDIHYEVAGKY